MPTRNPRRGAVCLATKDGIEPPLSGFYTGILPLNYFVKYPPGFQSKPLFSEVLPDGVFRSLLERLPLSPDGRFVIVLLVAVGFVICKVAL